MTTPTFQSQSPARVVVVGATGYSGLEACELLLQHPCAQLVGVFGSAKRAEGPTQKLADIFPQLQSLIDLPLEPYSIDAVRQATPDVVILATPHGASNDMAGPLLEANLKVVDISGGFRLRDEHVHQKHYGFARDESILARSAYGLPELYGKEDKDQLRDADLIACAGCYPTSAILPIAPLVRAGAVDGSRLIIVDSTSGTSGAGRAASVGMLLSEVSQKPYKVLAHRHNPEIDEHCGAKTVFTPHLGPYHRGIVSTIHVELNDGFDDAKVREIYEGAYRNEPFVRLLNAGEWPSVKTVERTNFCDIGFGLHDNGKHLVVCSAIDNLTKGAAGQAVQCMNIRLGLEETMGLLPSGLNTGAKHEAVGA